MQNQREQLVKAAQTVEDERNRQSHSPEEVDRLEINATRGALPAAVQVELQRAFADIQNLRSGALAGFQDEPETRTLEEYIAEVDEWADDLEEPALNSLLHRYCDAGHGLVHLRVSNDSTQYLPGVEVRLYIAFDNAYGFGSVPEADPIPKAPRPYGQAKPRLSAGWPGVSVPYMPSFGVQSEILLRDTTIEDGSIKVTLDAGELRPMATHDGDAFYIALPARPSDGSLHATWTATVQGRDGMIEGDLTIPVLENAIDITDLLTD